MADIALASAQGSCNPDNKNQLRLIPDEQLVTLLNCVKNEIHRRCSERKKQKMKAEAFAAIPEEIPDEYYKTVFGDGNNRMPRAMRSDSLIAPVGQRIKCLGDLLHQDWSYLWTEGDPQRRFCVYAHIDPSGKFVSLPKRLSGPSRMPFYIGKGTVSRAYDLNRNQGHGIRLRQLLEAGASKGDIVRILSDKLTEREALELEAKLIYFFGTIYEKHRLGILLNLDLSLRPEFRGLMRKEVSPPRTGK